MIIFRILYAPFYFLGFVGGAAAIISSGASPAWLFVLLLAAIATSLAAERLAPFEKQWNASQDDGKRDIAHALVNEASLVVLVLLLPLFTSLAPWPSVWPAALPFWADILLAIILLDVGITLAHFASHRISILWRFHAVHHSVRRMYGFNGLLKHPVLCRGSCWVYLLMSPWSPPSQLRSSFICSIRMSICGLGHWPTYGP